VVARIALRIVVELTLTLLGCALIVWAILANQQWFDQHFLPAFFVSRRVYVWSESLGRIMAAVTGTTIVFALRPRIGRSVARNGTLAVSVMLAVPMAIVTSEATLRYVHRHAAAEEPVGQEPRRRLDPQLGWTFVPSRLARLMDGGRIVEYAFDASGYRVRGLGETVDPDRPTIVFTGESTMVGEGLMWEESVPAQTGALLGVQSANLAVSAYATDQAFMRLRAELPRFRQPTAVVSVFAPALFDRNIDDDRPHLGRGLVWLPATERWRLLDILRLVVRYRKEETIERGIAVTREVLQATCDLARMRGAVPVVVLPQFMPEEPAEQALRQRVLDGTNLPVVRVELDRTWRIPGDGHPDPRAAHAIAVAIAARLRT
jgi:hypothetical protein